MKEKASICRQRGHGFSDKTLRDLKTKLDTVAAAENPFFKATGIGRKVHWLKPTLVAEVSFGEWAREALIRLSVFHGLRIDKKADVIIREQPVHTNPSKPKAAPNPASRPLLASLRVTHPERVIDPSTGFTKMELVRYYDLVGSLMMEHLKGRPVSLVRAPEGIKGQLFFQKHLEKYKMQASLCLSRI